MVPELDHSFCWYERLSVLALSSRFDGPIIMAFIVLALLSFSTRSVESF